MPEDRFSDTDTDAVTDTDAAAAADAYTAAAVTPGVPSAHTFGGSHDPASWEIARTVTAWWERHHRPPELFVALSGGADSLALTAGAIRTGARVTALIVDHHLQEGSTEIAHQAAAHARALGCVEAHVLGVTVPPSSAGLEAAARDARYEALAAFRNAHAANTGQTAQPTNSGTRPAPVLLGHTQDDQAETVLLGLIRSSGPRALRGMSEWDDPWGRPLLTVRRATTRQACAEHNLPVWDDPHNTNPQFTRVRVRHELLPLLCDIAHADVVPNLARTAQLLHDDEIAWEQQLPRDLSDQLAVTTLESLPTALQTRLIHRWLCANGPASTYGFRAVQEVLRLVTDWHGQGPISVEGNMVVQRKAGLLHITPAES